MSTSIPGITPNSLSSSGSLSGQFPNKKNVIFNINFDTMAGGVRTLELDAFKCVNSNINAIYTNALFVGSPITGLTTKSDATIYLVRTRLIKLIDVWNRILNSGLFKTSKMHNGATYPEIKMIGSNLINTLVEYLFKDLNNGNIMFYNLDFKTESIFYRIIRFLVSSANNINWYLINSLSNQTLFILTNTGQTNDLDKLININFNPTTIKFMSLMDELLDIVKELISETKLASVALCTFQDLTFTTAAGRTKIISLDAQKSNFPALAKIDDSDLTFLNDQTRALVQTWKDTGSNNIKYLYPQFATEITRNTESEAWSFRNVLVDTSDYNQGIDASLKKYQTKYIACSQLDMKKPLVFADQIINWSNPNDRPYIMTYNGGTYIYIPDEIKDQTTLNTLGEQPDNQVNISANFWKIGTSVTTDPNYDPAADIKLKLGNTPLHSLDKIDFFDNLTLYLKLN